MIFDKKNGDSENFKVQYLANQSSFRAVLFFKMISMKRSITLSHQILRSRHQEKFEFFEIRDIDKELILDNFTVFLRYLGNGKRYKVALSGIRFGSIFCTRKH